MAYDAILVLGGGVRENGELPGWVKTRFDLALGYPGDAPILCLSAGTVHRPNPLDHTGRPIFESVAGARYLLTRGVTQERIFIEASSWDTIGNAYFARVIHCDPALWRRLLVITSDAHMPRTETIFRWVFGLPPLPGYALDFASSADEGLGSELLAVRKEREAASLAAVRQQAGRIGTMQEMHQWIFTQHRAYRASLTSPPRASGPIVQAY